MTGVGIHVREISVDYPRRGSSPLRAVQDVSLDIPGGTTLALIGESGSGKSTIARSICGLVQTSAGAISVGEMTIGRGSSAPQRAGRAGVQLVAQDSTSALDPRWPIWRSIAEPARIMRRLSKAALRDLAVESLRDVGLSPDVANRLPRQLSGGQRQRVNIARALAANARVLVLDEAVSALDISVRNEILFLLDKLRSEHRLTYLFITHDMGPVVQLADHVAVLYLGGVVESGPVSEVVLNPQHPYSRALIDAVPVIGGYPDSTQRIGETDDPGNRPEGCWFHRRCPHAKPICKTEIPRTQRFANRLIACHRAGEFERTNSQGGQQ